MAVGCKSMDGHAGSVRSGHDVRRVRQVRQAQPSRHRRTDDAAKPIRRVGAAEHQVEGESAQSRREDIDRGAHARPGKRIVHHVVGAGGTHRQCLAQPVDGRPRPDRQQRHLAAVRFGQLERLLEQVFVVAVGLELAALRALVCLEPLGADHGHRLDEHDDVQAAYQGARFQSSRPEEPSVALKYSLPATAVR